MVRLDARLCAVVAAATAACTAVADLPALEVAEGGRHLQTVEGEPFFWLGDTACRLYRLDPEEVTEYMANRAAKGFTVVQGPVLMEEVANYAGQYSGSPSGPNEPWFEHIDLILDEAEAAGLYVAPVLTWGSQGGNFTAGSAESFGWFVGDRYRERSNIAAFIIAGEFNYPNANVGLWNAVAQGLRAGSAGNHLITIHPKWIGGYDGQTSSGTFHDADWLDFNMIQSSQFGDCTNDPESARYLGVHNWLLVEHDYGLEPVKPTLDAEPTYEQINPGGPPHCEFAQERWEAAGVRRRAYWSVFAGGFGHTYGANGVWQFHKEGDPASIGSPLDFWQTAMDYPGAAQVGLLRELVESRPFAGREPAQDLLLSDPGDEVPGHVHACRDGQGRWAMVYVPGPARTFTIDMDLLAGEVAIAWWFDPRTGDVELYAAYHRDLYGPEGELAFTTPLEGEDWVLIVDDASEDFSAPGSDQGAPSTLADVNGDGIVDVRDMVEVIFAWGPNPGSPADLNGDGWVNLTDLLLVTIQWSGGGMPVRP